jgi:hypothetical protein
VRTTTRPISTYPVPETPSAERRYSQFKASWAKATELLYRELSYLGVTELILEIDVHPWDLRQDGMPRANARPQGPRVVVYATLPNRDLRIPCDTFRDHAHNLYAIALTLEKLRAIDRYGVTTQGEQYRGFTALPAVTSVTTRVEAAWATLEREAGRDGLPIEREKRTREAMDILFRDATRRAHPDAGGSDERMAHVNRARSTIQESLLRDD